MTSWIQVVEGLAEEPGSEGQGLDDVERRSAREQPDHRELLLSRRSPGRAPPPPGASGGCLRGSTQGSETGLEAIACRTECCSHR